MKNAVRTWLAKADEDWLAVSWLLDERSPVISPALFHLQQCVEKLIKAYLTAQGCPFERRHDLAYLLSLAGDPDLERYADLLDELTPFAVEIRYPGALPAFTRAEARMLETRVAELRECLLSRLR